MGGRPAAYAEREPAPWPRRTLGRAIAVAVVAAVVAARRSARRAARSSDSIRRRSASSNAPARAVLAPRARAGCSSTRPRRPWLVDAGRLASGCSGATARRRGRRTGCFVAATRANELVALDPKGGVRWTLARPDVALPGLGGHAHRHADRLLRRDGLHIVAGDGTGDRLLGRRAASCRPPGGPGPAACSPTSDGPTCRAQDTDTGAVLWRRRGPAGRQLAWSADGRTLLVFSPHRTRAYEGAKVVAADDPSDATADRDAAFVGRTPEVAAIRVAGDGSNVFSLSSGRTFFRGTGVFAAARVVAGRALAARDVADGEPVGLRPYEAAEARRRLAYTQQFGRGARVEGWCCG